MDKIIPAYCVEYFYAKENCRAELKNALLQLAIKSRQEPGCEQYEVLQDKENSDLFIIVVKYSDQATMAKHEQQPYIKAFSDTKLNSLCEKFFWNDAIAVG